MASFDGATLKVTEPFDTSYSTATVCLWRLHGGVLDFIHLSATGVAEIAESTNLKGCSHAFVYVMYVWLVAYCCHTKVSQMAPYSLHIALPWSKVVQYVGNKVSFGTQPVRLPTYRCRILI